METQIEGLMDAIRASVVKKGARTFTSYVSSCPPHGPNLSLFSLTDFSSFLSPPPLIKPTRVSYRPFVATNTSFSLLHPLSSMSASSSQSPFYICVSGSQHVPVTDVVRDGEDEDSNISLKDLSHKLQEFAKARDWEKYHTPRNLLLAMVGEVGELSEIFQWKGEVVRGLEDWEESEKEHLGEELSDVLLYLIRLADACGIDLAQASLNKILKNAIKYPIDHS